MDKNSDFNFYGIPPFGGNPMYDMNFEQQSQSQNNFDTNPMLNPFMQYEQAYMYYRYLAMQMEYKIKCKEYENLNSKISSREPGRKIE